MRSFVAAGLVASVAMLSAGSPASALPIDTLASVGHSDIVRVQFDGQRRFNPGGTNGHVGGGIAPGGHAPGGGARFGGGHGGDHGGGHGFGGGRGFDRGHGNYAGGHRGGGFGLGAGLAGLAAGAIVGGAIANSPGYGDPYYGPDAGYGPAPVYGYGPGYAEDAPIEPVAGDQVAYCESRFHSYDPRSGTYLGFDGQRHPCP